MQFYEVTATAKNLIATLLGMDAHDDDRRWCSTICSILGCSGPAFLMAHK